MTKFVFVCTGNTCRSPMAEAIMKNKGFEAKSAGIFAFPGAPISKEAQDVLKENGIEFDHTAKTFHQQLGEWADIILTMTQSHKDYMAKTYPMFTSKLYTLKEYAVGEPGDVMDPFGGTIDTYRSTFRELESLLERVADKTE